MPRPPRSLPDGSFARPYYVHDLDAPHLFRPKGWVHVRPVAPAGPFGAPVLPLWAQHCPAPFLVVVRSAPANDRRVYAHPLARDLLSDRFDGMRDTAAKFLLRVAWALEADREGTVAALDAAWWLGREDAVTQALDALVAGLPKAAEYDRLTAAVDGDIRRAILGPSGELAPAVEGGP